MPNEANSPSLDNHRPERRATDRALVGPPLVVCFILALAYSYIIPLGYGPDEPRHFNLIKLLWVDHKLPRVLPDGREFANAIALHPPTYYLIEGLLWYPAQWLANTLAPHAHSGLLRRLVIGAEPAPVPDELLPRAIMYRIFRLTSPLWGLLIIWLVFRAIRCTWPNAPWLASATAWAMALWPHLLMNFATITNDCGANLAGAVFVWYWACAAPRRNLTARDAALAGLVLALAALMKIHVAACLLLLTLLALAWPYGRRFAVSPAFWRNAAIALAVAAALAGPWYARNIALYGRLNYVPQGYRIIPPGMGLIDGLATGILGSALAATISGLFRSLWAQVGWLPSALTLPAYLTLALITALSILGLVRLSSRRKPIDWTAARPALCLILPFPTAWMLAVYVALFVHFGWHEGGRYLLFALPGFIIPLLAGLAAVIKPKPTIYIFVALLALLNLASAYNLLAHLNPTYGGTVLIGQ